MSDNLGNLFTFKPMKEFATYMSSYNAGDQLLVIDATNGAMIEDTGTKLMFINGVPIVKPVDAQLNFEADTTGTESAWAAETSYTVNSSYVTSKGYRLKCLATHTSSVAGGSTEPFVGEDWWKKWRVQPHDAVNASGSVITTAYSQWFIVTSNAAGTLAVWEAGDQALATTEEFKCPVYDPTLYCVIGAIHVANASGANVTMGTTALNGSNITTRYMNFVGPVFPHTSLMDKN